MLKYLVDKSQRLQHEELDIQPNLPYKEEATQIHSWSMHTFRKKEVSLVKMIWSWQGGGSIKTACGDAFLNSSLRRTVIRGISTPSGLSFDCVKLHDCLFVVASCWMCTTLGKFQDKIFLGGGGCKALTVCLMVLSWFGLFPNQLSWIHHLSRFEYGMVYV